MSHNSLEISFATTVTQANQRAGHKRNYKHPFFSAENLAAFNTKIPHAYLIGGDLPIINKYNDIVFITADDIHDHSTQRFTLRLLDADGKIVNLSEFQEFESVHKALRALRAYMDNYGADVSASDV